MPNQKITVTEARKLLPQSTLSGLNDQQIMDIIRVMYTCSEYIFNHIVNNKQKEEIHT